LEGWRVLPYGWMDVLHTAERFYLRSRVGFIENELHELRSMLSDAMACDGITEASDCAASIREVMELPHSTPRSLYIVPLLEAMKKCNTPNCRGLLHEALEWLMLSAAIPTEARKRADRIVQELRGW